MDRPPKTHAEYMRHWRANNPKNADYQKRYQEQYLADPKNREKARARAREYYERNKNNVKNRQRDLYHATKQLKGYASGPRSANWKGDEVGYHGLHKWVARHRGRPAKCEHCGLCDPKHPKRFHWANKSHEYRRSLDDWLRLCGKCHFKYDEQHRRTRDVQGRLL